MSRTKLEFHPNVDGSGIEFCDELGMFRIFDENVRGRGKMKDSMNKVNDANSGRL